MKTQQNEDGGFGWAFGVDSDFDDTSAAIQALIAGGEPRDSDVIKKALSYLKTGQNDDGGVRYYGTAPSNSASDSWAIQALVAAGINPREWISNNISVVDHLLSLQSPKGYFKYTEYQTSNPGFMTVSAIMALLGKSHPIKPGEWTSIRVNQSMKANETQLENTTLNETEGSTSSQETPSVYIATPTPTPFIEPVNTHEKPAEQPLEQAIPEKTTTPVQTPEQAKKMPGFLAVTVILVFEWWKAGRKTDTGFWP